MRARGRIPDDPEAGPLAGAVLVGQVFEAGCELEAIGGTDGVDDEIDGGLGGPIHRVRLVSGIFFVVVVLAALLVCSVHEKVVQVGPELFQGEPDHAAEPPVPPLDPVEILLDPCTVGSPAPERAVRRGRSGS
jgi:hypothetical protein